LDPGYTNVGYPTPVPFCTLFIRAKNMENAALAQEKLRRIQLLWADLECAKVGSPEYETLMEKIRALSSEYHALVDPPKKPKKMK
jgi:hypothetical protein